MDELNNDSNDNIEEVDEMEEEEELSLSDKMIGVFTEPAATFSQVSKETPKTTDWIIPLLCIMAVTILMQVIVFSRADLKQQSIEKQMEATEKYLSNMVDEGQMSQEQADQALDAAAERMDQQMGVQLIIGIVAVVIMSFIMFFIVSGVFILISKFALGGEGTYKSGLTAYGLPMYITVVQLLVTLILILTTGSIDTGTNVAKLAGMSTKEISGYMVSFLDPFSIWFYSIIGVSFAKIYKSENTIKYVASFLLVWVIFGTLFFLVAQSVPLLQNFIR